MSQDADTEQQQSGAAGTLSSRELLVLQLYARGYTPAHIAALTQRADSAVLTNLHAAVALHDDA